MILVIFFFSALSGISTSLLVKVDLLIKSKDIRPFIYAADIFVEIMSQNYQWIPVYHISLLLLRK